MEPSRSEARADGGVDSLARRLGLSRFPLPGGFEGRLRQLGPHVLTSREDDVGPYDMWRLRAELDDTDLEYALLGADGRGFNSWALHWHVVEGPLALLLQVQWGGVMSSSGEDTEFAMGLVDRAVELHRLAMREPRPDRRLRVVASTFGDSSVQWDDGTILGTPGWRVAAALGLAEEALAG